jgi:hypothetical protein
MLAVTFHVSGVKPPAVASISQYALSLCSTLIAVTLPNCAAMVLTKSDGYTVEVPSLIIVTSPETRPIVTVVPTGIAEELGNETVLALLLLTLIYFP